jgi:phage/plasmid-associated DNA primase
MSRTLEDKTGIYIAPAMWLTKDKYPDYHIAHEHVDDNFIIGKPSKNERISQKKSSKDGSDDEEDDEENYYDSDEEFEPMSELPEKKSNTLYLYDGGMANEIIRGVYARPFFDFDMKKGTAFKTEKEQKKALPKFVADCVKCVKEMLETNLARNYENAKIDVYEGGGESKSKGGWVNSVHIIVRNSSIFMGTPQKNFKDCLQKMGEFFKINEICGKKSTHPMKDILDKDKYICSETKFRMPYQIKKPGDSRQFRRVVLKNGKIVRIINTLEELMKDSELKVRKTDLLVSWPYEGSWKEQLKKEAAEEIEKKKRETASEEGSENPAPTDVPIRIEQVYTKGISAEALRPFKKPKNESAREFGALLSDSDWDEDEEIMKSRAQEKQTDLTLEELEQLCIIYFTDKMQDREHWRRWVRICQAYAYFKKTKQEQREVRDFCKRMSQMTEAAKAKYTENGFREKWSEKLPDDSDQWITAKTLIKDVKEQYPQEYEQWQNKKVNPERKFLQSHGQHADVAEYFIEKWGKDSIFCNNEIYTWNPKTGWYLNMMGESITRLLTRDMYAPVWAAYNEMIAEENERFERNCASGKYPDDKSKKQAKKSVLNYSKKLEKVCANLRTTSFVNGCKSMIQQLMLKKGDGGFDEKPHLIGFNNGVYDLLEHKFRNHEREDYITMSTGYDYEDSMAPNMQKKINKIKEIISQIYVNPEHREFNMKCLSTGIYGEQIQKFFIALGSGGNGKDLLLEKLPSKALGGYYKKASTDIIQSKVSGVGACPEIASLNKVRWVCFLEPSSQDQIRSNKFCEITGTATLSGRYLYDNKDSDKKMHGTCFLCCMSIPRFDNVKNRGVQRRAVEIDHNSVFVRKDEMQFYKDRDNVFLENMEYLTEKFLVEHRMAYMHVLIEYFRKYQADGSVIQTPPKDSQAKLEKHLLECDDVMSWFLANFESESARSKREAEEKKAEVEATKKMKEKEKTKDKDKKHSSKEKTKSKKHDSDTEEEPEKKDITRKLNLPDGYYNGSKTDRKPVLPLEYVFKEFKKSDAYQKLSTTDKSKMTKSGFYDELKNQNKIKVDYVAKIKVYEIYDGLIQTSVSKKTKKELPHWRTISNALIGWAKKPSEVSDIDKGQECNEDDEDDDLENYY